MAGRINRNILKNEIKAVKRASIEKQAMKIAQNILNEKKDKYINDIKSHPVSIELNAGSESDNTSRTLDAEGNLFTFIGFDKNANPVDDLISHVEMNTSIRKIESKKDDVFEFEVITPSIDEISSVTPMPFENGNSWVKGIERGISGFSYYLYGLMFPSSRSGKGIQTKNKIRRSNYKPIKYFSSLYRNFILSFKNVS